MRFSILICSLEHRQALLERLLACLPAEPGVEVLVERDAGQLSVGEKRNRLLERSTGDWVAFVDDDDRVAPDYVSRILKALEQAPDCVGIEGVMTTNGRGPRRFVHSMQYLDWFERDGVYYRCPNHLNPVRRSLAIRAGFPARSFGEDHDYSLALQPLLGSEVFLEGPVYFYEFCRKKRGIFGLW